MRHAFDLVVIGSGAGGGTLAHALAPTGARILLVERGGFVPREPENWDPAAVWKHLRYRTGDWWFSNGRPFRPYTHYCVGGNTKFWGSVLYRLRREDFEVVEHADGVSPAWPIDYDTLAPYYERAERLYQVHGEAGLDPTEPPRGPYPHPPIPHAPEIEEIVERLRAQGLHPSPLPLGLIRPGEADGCILCNTCNSFPCRLHAKSEAEVCCVGPATDRPNVTLWTGARARRLVTDAPGRRVTAVEVVRNRKTVLVEAPLFVVSCGAVNSAALLFRSESDRHPDGLANSSGAGRPALHGAPRDDDAGVPSVPAEPGGLPEDGRDQRLLPPRAGRRAAPGTDPVAGENARGDGADRRAVGAAPGIRRLGGARRRLAGHDRGPAAAREPGHPGQRAAASTCGIVPTTCARTGAWCGRCGASCTGSDSGS